MNKYLCECVWVRERKQAERICVTVLFGYALQLHWSLSLSDHLVVALEDASLIQMNVDTSGPDMTVQGRRREILSPIKVRSLTLHTAT